MEWDLYRKVSKRQHFAQWRSLILCGFARSVKVQGDVQGLFARNPLSK